MEIKRASRRSSYHQKQKLTLIKWYLIIVQRYLTYVALMNSLPSLATCRGRRAAVAPFVQPQKDIGIFGHKSFSDREELTNERSPYS